MPATRYFEVTEVRTIRVRAETVSGAIQVAEAGFNEAPLLPEGVEGGITRGPITTEMHAKEDT